MNLTIDELLSTTRAVRKRLDLDRPVSRDVVEGCLRLAFQAPTGQNDQDWGWVVIDDPDVRGAAAEIYRRGLADHLEQGRAMTRQAAAPTDAETRISDSVAYLVAHLQEVPMLLVPTIGAKYGAATPFGVASRWGSILPAVWSFMLALRSREMGSAWTTLHLYREQAMAELLGIPDDHLQVGLFPIAYTQGTDFKPADRSRSESRIFWNHWTPPATAR